MFCLKFSLQTENVCFEFKAGLHYMPNLQSAEVITSCQRLETNLQILIIQNWPISQKVA